MTIVFNTLSSPTYQQNPLVTPLLKFHSKTISLWNNLSKESPVYKMATRALIAVVAPFGYLALGLVALVGWALNSKLQGKAIHVKKSGGEDSIGEPDDETKEVEDEKKSGNTIETDTQEKEVSVQKEAIMRMKLSGFSPETNEAFLKSWQPGWNYAELDFSQTSIDESHHSINDVHLILICQILAQNATLKKLIFNGNQDISFLGIKTLITSLNWNHTLETIEMKKMSFSHLFENLTEKLSSELRSSFPAAEMKVEGSTLKITYKPRHSDQHHTLTLVC